MTYADAVGSALLSRGWSIRELAAAVGKSYEHCRKIVRGESVVSEELNAHLCKALGLDAEQMWHLALRQKAVERFGVTPKTEPQDTQGRALLAAWRHLQGRDRTIILAMARRLGERYRYRRGGAGANAKAPRRSMRRR